MIGKILSHYEITGLLGKGGMGEVYRARDTKLDRDVAIKVLPRETSTDPDRIARFQREARTLATLQHPNVASIYGFEESGEVRFLVMELVEGEDLGQRLQRGPVPIEEAIDIALLIATGLEAAHDKGVIHRDLKPANVKLGTDGSVKILDFGLARAYEGDADPSEGSATSPTMTAAMTNAGVILGTAAYMSPEQARGKAMDKRTDIFSYGVVLYEMLTGKRPFQGETLSDTLASVLKESADQESLPRNTPPALRLVLDRCLEKDGKQRLRDIREARLILEAVKSGDDTASSLLGNIPAVGDSPKGRSLGLRLREITAWTLAAAALVFLTIQLMPGRDSSADPESAWKLAVPIDGEVDLRYSHGGLVISPDGSRIAYINQDKLFIRRLDSWESIEIPESEGAANPFWSYDGKWLAYAKEREFWKVRLDGTQRTRIGAVETPVSNITGGAWLADDHIVYRGEVDLLKVPAAGGRVDTLYSATSDTALVDFHQPHALPGGKGLISVVHTPEGPNTIGIVSQTGELKNVLALPGSDLAHPCYSPSGHIIFQKDSDIWAAAFSLEHLEVTGDSFPVAREAAAPSVSNEGTLTYVRNAGEILRQFVLVNRAGEIVKRLGQPADMWAAYALSSDGTRAVASRSVNPADLWLFDTRMARTRITFTDLEHDMPTFSWDGRTVYFATGIESDYRIGRKSVDRNEPETLLVPAGELGPHFYASCPAINRDETVLFYSAIGANKKQDIAWLDLTTDGKPQPFLTSEAAEYSAQPSPADHHFLAYVSEESGAPQVYLTTWPGADQKLSVSIDGGLWPRWKGDGSEIYFAFKNDIYAVEVQYDPLRLGRPVKLFSRPEHDDRQPMGWPATFGVAADGERFLTTELVTDSKMDPGIAIIRNWASSLEQD